MPIIILSLLLELCLVLPIIKTGRSTRWIWVIVMLPLVGTLAYFYLEILPELSKSRSGRNAGKKLRTAVNPNKDINEATRDFEATDTVANSIRLASEYVNKGHFSEAKDLYQRSLRGVHSDDPDIMQGLAKCKFELGQYEDAKNTLDTLIEKNPDFKNQEAHLVYARTLEKLGDDISAKHEYETLHNYATGPEASFYYAKYLRAKGEEEAATTVFKSIVDHSKNAGRHYKELYGATIAEAKSELYNS